MIYNFYDQRFMRLRNRDRKRRCDINSNAYKPREAKFATFLLVLLSIWAGPIRIFVQLVRLLSLWGHQPDTLISFSRYYFSAFTLTDHVCVARFSM